LFTCVAAVARFSFVADTSDDFAFNAVTGSATLGMSESANSWKRLELVEDAWASGDLGS
uniref:CIA30 domain-containing protein n=1 Tax=Heligmosomoides polygyrus TaxID=6339 RepID=A0A183FPY8_HELPZ